MNFLKSTAKRFISSILACSILATSIISTNAYAEESLPQQTVIGGAGITITIDENGNVVSATNDNTISGNGISISIDENGNVISATNGTQTAYGDGNEYYNNLEQNFENNDNKITEPIKNENDNNNNQLVFDSYYSLIDDASIQTRELMIKTKDKDLIKGLNIISNYDDIYIIAFENITEAKYAYSYYIDKVDFVSDLSSSIILASEENTSDEISENTSENVNTEPTTPTISEENNDNTTSQIIDENVSEPESVDEPVNEPTNEPVKESPNEPEEPNVINAITILADTDINDYSGYIAVIDTGANNADANLSVFDDNGEDTNGHGSQMIEYIREENPNAKILSIKAFEGRVTNVMNLYAAIRMAINSNVSAINLSLAGFDMEKNAIIIDIIQEAIDNGIVVIGSAGNYNSNALNYIPGCIDDVITVGAINPDKTKYSISNYNADVYVVATSTSEAAARYMGMYAADNFDLDRITYSIDGNLDEEDDTNGEEQKENSTGTQDDKKVA